MNFSTCKTFFVVVFGIHFMVSQIFASNNEQQGAADRILAKAIFKANTDPCYQYPDHTRCFRINNNLYVQVTNEVDEELSEEDQQADKLAREIAGHNRYMLDVARGLHRTQNPHTTFQKNDAKESNGCTLKVLGVAAVLVTAAVFTLPSLINRINKNYEDLQVDAEEKDAVKQEGNEW